MTVVLIGAGLLAATVAHGRSGSSVTTSTQNRIANLVAAEQRQVDAATAEQQQMQAQVQALTAQRAQTDARVDAARSAGASLQAPVGLLPVTGAAYTVSLDDAPRGAPVAAGYPPPTPDDLVVHQQDVQAVVNALWAGGATAMTVMGKRLIATSAVRCVGNTLLLQGRVYSPPFVVSAVGDPAALAAAVSTAPGVVLFGEYVAAYGLRFQAGPVGVETLPGYDGPISLTETTALAPPVPSTESRSPGSSPPSTSSPAATGQ